MSEPFTAIPSRSRLAEWIFLCFFVLSAVLALISWATVPFSPLLAALNLYTVPPWGAGGVLGIAHAGALTGFVITWLASPRLRRRYRPLSMIILALELLLAALPG